MTKNNKNISSFNTPGIIHMPVLGYPVKDDHTLLWFLENAAMNMGQAKLNSIDPDTGEVNGITHDEYDESIDIISILEEQELDNLDENQLKLYHEHVKTVKIYEGTMSE